MKLTWIGHSCFRVEKDGFCILTDPYQDDSVPGLLPVREKANIVICSHEHGDHNGRAAVLLADAVPNPFRIEKIETYHDHAQGAKRGRNQITILDDGENRIAHLGDLGCELEPEQLEKLKNLDAVLIPVGGYYTIDASQAAELVREIAPRIVIPMHYRSESEGFGFEEIGTVEEFTDKMDRVKCISSSQLETTCGQEAQVIVLRPANRRR